MAQTILQERIVGDTPMPQAVKIDIVIFVPVPQILKESGEWEVPQIQCQFVDGQGDFAEAYLGTCCSPDHGTSERRW